MIDISTFELEGAFVSASGPVNGPAPDVAQRYPMHVNGHTELVQALLVASGRQSNQLVHPAQVPDWVMLGLCSELSSWVGERSTVCPHKPEFVRYADPAVAAAWAPGHLMCIDCIDLLHNIGADDMRCNGCGRPSSDGRISTVTVTFACFGYQVRVCDRCPVADLEDGAVGTLAAPAAP